MDAPASTNQEATTEPERYLGQLEAQLAALPQSVRIDIVREQRDELIELATDLGSGVPDRQTLAVATRIADPPALLARGLVKQYLGHVLTILGRVGLAMWPVVLLERVFLRRPNGHSEGSLTALALVFLAYWAVGWETGRLRWGEHRRRRALTIAFVILGLGAVLAAGSIGAAFGPAYYEIEQRAAAILKRDPGALEVFAFGVDGHTRGMLVGFTALGLSFALSRKRRGTELPSDLNYMTAIRIQLEDDT